MSSAYIFKTKNESWHLYFIIFYSVTITKCVLHPCYCNRSYALCLLDGICISSSASSQFGLDGDKYMIAIFSIQ